MRWVGLLCVALTISNAGCISRAEWKTQRIDDGSTVNEILILTSDSVIHASGVQFREGRARGQVVQAWRRPAGLAVFPHDSDAAPGRLAKLAGWEETTLPKALDLSYDDLKSVRVLVPSRRAILATTVLVAVIGGLIVLLVAGIKYCGEREPGPNDVSLCPR